MSLFRKFLHTGAAYGQHVKFAKTALAASDDQRPNVITEYVQGLTDASFAGLTFTLAMLAGQEKDGRVKQEIQSLLQNIDATRTGKLQAAKPPELTTNNTDDADWDLVNHWLRDLTQDEWKTALLDHLFTLDSAGYNGFTKILEKMKANQLNTIQQHKANELEIVGGRYFEDRMAYFFASERTGAKDREFMRVLRQYEQTLNKLELIITESHEYWLVIHEPRDTL